MHIGRKHSGTPPTGKTILAMLAVVLAAGQSYAQFYDSGQDRFRRLSMINTEHFQLIFPKGDSVLGQAYANNLEQVYLNASQTLDYKPRRITAVLQTSTAYANGEVVWAPRHINLFTTASHDNYYQDWSEQLALHEFRHVVQTSKLDQGATHVFNCLLGEQFTGLVLGVHIPLWFMEGDAVAYETGASDAGRGRVNNFRNELLAQVAQKGIFSYQKAMFGSYADHVPSRYNLGYQIVSYGRAKYGIGIWQAAINRTATHPIALRPFSRGIKQTAGISEKQLYRAALSELAASSKQEASKYTAITRPNASDYTCYYTPQKLSDGRIVAYCEQMSDIPALIEIDTATGQHRVIVHPGYMSNKHFSSSGNGIVWNQIRYTRWDLANHSQVIYYNIANNSKRTIIRRGRYYCSTLSPDCRLIASASTNGHALWHISINDTCGSPVRQIPTNGIVPVRLAWSGDSTIVFIGINSNYKSVFAANIQADSITQIAPAIQSDIGNLLADGQYVYFTGNYNGNDAWFRYNTADGVCQMIAMSEFGVGSGSIVGDTLLFTYYTADGYQIAEQRISDSVSAMPQKLETELTRALSEQEQHVTFSTDSNYAVSRYSRLAHLINIHSWGPLSVRIDESEIGPGLTFMSQDALSTSFLTAGYQYYFADQINNLFADYCYKGFFPIFGVRGDADYYQTTVIDSRSWSHNVNVKQKKITAYMQVPMILRSGAFSTALTMQVAYQYKTVHADDNQKLNYDNTHHTMACSIAGYTMRRLAQRDLQTKLGITVNADSRRYSDVSGCWQSSVQGWIYLPGLFRNHGICLYAGYQESSKDVSFGSRIQYPRGTHSNSETKITSLSGSYVMPLFYPDFCMGDVVYLKRIRARAFYDCAVNVRPERRLQSAGCDVVGDMYIYRLPMPVSIGCRYARLIATSGYYFGLLASVNFSTLYN